MIVLAILCVWCLHEYLQYRDRFMWLIPMVLGVVYVMMMGGQKVLETKCTENKGVLVANYCIDAKTVIELK